MSRLSSSTRGQWCFSQLGLFGFVEMLVFVRILAVGLCTSSRKGRLRRREPQRNTNEMPDTGLLAKIEGAFPGKIMESTILYMATTASFSIGTMPSLSLPRCEIIPSFAFNLLSDLTAIDFLGQEPRFEFVYQLYSIPSISGCK